MRKNKIGVRLKRGDDFILVHPPFYKSVEKPEATVYELEYAGEPDDDESALDATVKFLSRKGLIKKGIDVELTFVK